MTQSSVGQAIPLLYGRQRMAGNLIFAMYFIAQPHSPTTGAGGKGGALPGGLVSYTYNCSIMLAFCENSLDWSDPDVFGVPVAVPQLIAIGRAQPGRQVMTTSDATGEKANPQPLAGWAPALWVAKRIRRVLNDQGKGTGVGDPNGRVNSDGDDLDDIKEFRTIRVHNWDEPPDADAGATGVRRYLSGPRDLARGAWKNQAVAAGKKLLHQRDAYIVLAGENYFGLACLAREFFQFGSNASVPNVNVPVNGLMQFRDVYGGHAGTLYGADPACVLVDCLTNPKHGAGWDRGTYTAMLQGYPTPWGALDATPPADSWSAYCRATNILIDPLYDSQRAMADIVSDLAEVSNAAPVWSEGILKMIPYGDAEVVSAETGITFTPETDPDVVTDGANIGVRFALTLDDFLPGKNKDHVHVERRAVVPDIRGDYKSDGLFNHVRVEFLRADAGYATHIAEAKDAGSIAVHGLISREPYQRHDITTPNVAQAFAERQLKRLSAVRNVYTFTLGWQFLQLEPMDVVSIPSEAIGVGLTGRVYIVRLTSIEEDKDGALTIEAEDFPRDLGAAAIIPPPDNPDLTPDGEFIWFGSTVVTDTDTRMQHFDVLGIEQAQKVGTGNEVGAEAQYGMLGLPLSANHEFTALCAEVTLNADYLAATPDLLRAYCRLCPVVDGVPQLGLAVLFAPGELGVRKFASGSVFVQSDSTVTMLAEYLQTASGGVFDPFDTPVDGFQINWSLAGRSS